ncbi:MAG: hypothetical protein ACOY46_05290 [Bacillota bacterium]
MLENLNEYLQALHSGHKYPFALILILSTAVIGALADTISKIPIAWNWTHSMLTANRRKGSPRW